MKKFIFGITLFLSLGGPLPQAHGLTLPTMNPYVKLALPIVSSATIGTTAFLLSAYFYWRKEARAAALRGTETFYDYVCGLLTELNNNPLIFTVKYPLFAGGLAVASGCSLYAGHKSFKILRSALTGYASLDDARDALNLAPGDPFVRRGVIAHWQKVLDTTFASAYKRAQESYQVMEPAKSQLETVEDLQGNNQAIKRACKSLQMAVGCFTDIAQEMPTESAVAEQCKAMYTAMIARLNKGFTATENDLTTAATKLVPLFDAIDEAEGQKREEQFDQHSLDRKIALINGLQTIKATAELAPFFTTAENVEPDEQQILAYNGLQNDPNIIAMQKISIDEYILPQSTAKLTDKKMAQQYQYKKLKLLMQGHAVFAATECIIAIKAYPNQKIRDFFEQGIPRGYGAQTDAFDELADHAHDALYTRLKTMNWGMINNHIDDYAKLRAFMEAMDRARVNDTSRPMRTLMEKFVAAAQGYAPLKQYFLSKHMVVSDAVLAEFRAHKDAIAGAGADALTHDKLLADKQSSHIEGFLKIEALLHADKSKKNP